MIFAHVGSAAAESNNPIDVEIEDYEETVCYANCPEYGYSGDMPQGFITHVYTKVMIQSKVDIVKVERVEINRGNCQFFGGSLPQELRFGEQVSLVVQKSDTVFAKGCNILEINVETDQGEVLFSD